MGIGQPGVHGGQAGLRAVADEKKDEGQLNDRRMQVGSGGHQNRPVQGRFLPAGDADEIEIAEGRAAEGQRDAHRADQDVLPRRLDGGLRHVERDEHGRRNRRGFDRDPHEPDVVTHDREEHRKREEIAENPEPSRLRRVVLLVAPEPGAQPGRHSAHHTDDDREQR